MLANILGGVNDVVIAAFITLFVQCAIAILIASTYVVSIVSTIATFWVHTCHFVFSDFLDYGYLGGSTGT